MLSGTINNLPPELVLSIPLFAITLNQVKAILNRDNRECKVPWDHDCRGKLSVHHVNGDLGDRADDPDNLITVCRSVHWGKLHNGATLEEKLLWAGQLAILAVQNTTQAISRGWKFPKD